VPKSSRELVDLILLGPTGDRRQLQDSPILGDVWIKYAVNPRKEWDLLITPEKKFPAGAVAGTIAKAVRKLRGKIDPEDKDSAKVACLQALIAAKLTFQELLQVVVPMTVWWKDRDIQEQLAKALRGKRSLKPSQSFKSASTCRKTKTQRLCRSTISPNSRRWTGM
jgi:hypothetical protein